MMTQFKEWSTRNQARNKETVERCFRSPQLLLKLRIICHILYRCLSRLKQVVSEQTQSESRQALLAGKHESINEKDMVQFPGKVEFKYNRK
jgi:hypothetical protein